MTPSGRGATGPDSTETTPRKPRKARTSLILQEAWANDPKRRQKYRQRVRAAGRAFNFVGDSSTSGALVDPDFDEGF